MSRHRPRSYEKCINFLSTPCFRGPIYFHKVGTRSWSLVACSTQRSEHAHHWWESLRSHDSLVSTELAAFGPCMCLWLVCIHALRFFDDQFTTTRGQSPVDLLFWSSFSSIKLATTRQHDNTLFFSHTYLITALALLIKVCGYCRARDCVPPCFAVVATCHSSSEQVSGCSFLPNLRLAMLP